MRALKGLVIGMGVLIVIGTVTLVWVVVQRVTAAGSGANAPPFSLALGQAEGTRIGGIAPAEGGAVAIWVTGGPEGDRVLVVDPRRGRVLGEIRAGR